MKRPLLLILVVLLLSVVLPVAAAPVIANHTGTHLEKIPVSAILAAKSRLHIAYWHTSHGSQITTGMSGLVSFPNAPYGGSVYTYNPGGTGGALDLTEPASTDLGNSAWPTVTRNYLAAHPDVNVVIWSWCGQLSTATSATVTSYLNQMNQLEADYPNVKFVYMTGHLDGSGSQGNLNQRNEQIRAYARAHNKTLYDFADIESFDPDGKTNYMLLHANDNCDYDGGKNWAISWQNSHTQNVDWYMCTPAHTQPLNGNQKAYAAWWLWARIAGWDGTAVPATSSPGVFRPSTRQFILRNGLQNITIGYGLKTDKPVSGDWNGDGRWDVGVYRPSNATFFLKNGTKTTAVRFGGVTDTPVTGDWNGDGRWDVGVYRPSNSTFLLKTGTKTVAIRFGKVNDIPVCGDWNGDGQWDVGVYRPSNATFLLKTGTKTVAIRFGKVNDIPVCGDWNGDGRWEVGVYRNQTFFLKDGTGITGVKWGIAKDLPVSGDWNGDGRWDVGVYRPSNVTFYLKNGTRSTNIRWGLIADKPVIGKWR